MHQKIYLLIALVILFLIIGPGMLLFRTDVIAQQVYPPPATSQPATPQNYTYHLPLIIRTFPPPAAPSYYIENLNTLYDLGYTLGIHDHDTPSSQDNLVILDYGYPAKQGSEYGAFLVFDQSGTFYSMSRIITSAIDFARGYYYGTGSDVGSHLRIIIGFNSCCNENTVTFFRGHGTAFGQAVDSIRSGIGVYSNQVDAVGGGDIEMSFNGPFSTAEWFNSYMASSTCVPGSNSSVDGCFYNFGNLAISISGTICANEQSDPWNACDVWYVSWGAQKNSKRFPRPLPEIYHGSETLPPWGTDATAWKDLSIFSANQMAAEKIYFVGTLTQRAECGDGCGSGNNYPWEGYRLLYDALASNSTTKMALRWSTDITEQP